MSSNKDQTRRAAMTSLASLSLAAAQAADVASGSKRGRVSTLVAFFSRSGNTRVVAGLIQRAFDADVFEIRPAIDYLADYLATVAQAKQERDTGFEPALAGSLPGIAAYDTVFLCFPIWGETTPPVVRSFLSSHDLAGKTLVPFVTHGGYGLGNSEAVVRQHAPKARLRRGFAMQADQERETMDRVNDWLREQTVKR
jgi:flavodoxin